MKVQQHDFYFVFFPYFCVASILHRFLEALLFHRLLRQVKLSKNVGLSFPDILEDMKEECQKYGSVVSLLIPKENPGKGQVILFVLLKLLFKLSF